MSIRDWFRRSKREKGEWTVRPAHKSCPKCGQWGVYGKGFKVEFKTIDIGRQEHLSMICRECGFECWTDCLDKED